ncbi:protein SWEETIE-like isoform X1 [Papaver somniferum]|uniref:protein SWEETIE-like isoform X1 n=2 Tax=Papaver somniferum TaxID=3469 RepID=UPI000E7045BC|nr:protein SWEETIE-like isoform X1 [Papaver somniferum]
MAKNFVRENVPLSRFGVLVAQLESIVASAAQQPPESVLCFDLLSDLISAIDEEPKDSILLWQRKCEDALYSLLIRGAHRPVRHLASLAMARIISKGDGISIYSRASSLQGLLSDGKRSEPLRAAGASQCLGELYRNFGRRITSGLLETTNIAAKLIRFNEDFVRQEALEMLQNALEGSGGTGAFAAYAEAFRLIMRIGVWDKSFIVRIAAARCLKTFASIGGPGLGVTELDNSATYCVKVLEDPMSSVRDAFSEALGALLALGMNPEAQVQPRGKTPATPTRKLDGCLQKHLTGPFVRANGVRAKDVRIGLTLSWVFFLQAIRLKYFHPDSDLSEFALQALDMLRGDSSVDAHALACVLYILRVGLVDQMTESTQRSFLVLLGRQLESHDISPSMEVAVLRTCSYILKTLGEVPLDFKEVLDNTVVAALSHSAVLVRIEAALTLRALAEVDPTCVGGLISFAATTINALRESVSFEKGSKLQLELDALHGQATILAALVSISPKLPLGYPAKLPKLVLDVSRKLLTEYSRNPVAATAKNEAGWLLLASLIASMPKEELEDQVFDILSLWASPFGGIQEYAAKQNEDLTSEIRVWSAAIGALTAFIRSFISQPLVASDNGVLLQPVLIYLGRALSYISLLTLKQPPNVKPALDLFVIRTLIAYQSLPDPMAYKNDHASIIQICTIPFREPSGCEESSCLRSLLDKRDAWLGPWIPGRDWFEDELKAFQGGKDGMMPCVWENELYTFPRPETTGKMLVNQMLSGYGMLFATQDRSGKLSLLGMIEQCLKVGKKQAWHAASVTNACVGLLAGLKAFVALRPQPLCADILGSSQAIFQIFTYSLHTENSQMSLVVPVLLQIVKVSTDDFFEAEDFASIAMELCVVHIYKVFHSSNTSSQDDLSCEDLVSASVETAEILIHRFKSQMKLNTVIACLMTSYNCLRGASTDSGLLKVVSLVQSMGSILKKHIKDAKLDADGFAQLKTVFEAWLLVIINLSQDCTKGIHMQENKKTKICKSLQMKLAFCLEQAFSIAKLVHETQLLVENEDINKLLFSVYKCCCKCLQRTLTDSSTQVQISALQVLKSMAQKDLGDGSNVDNSPFFMFFVGELFEEVFNVVENALKKPMRKESATVVGECLRLLVLLHALSKEGKCQKGLLNLFLEAVIMVVSASSDDSSQEVLEIRSTAVRLVSHIAQMPSSAIHFKDVLLAMPVTQRQQLQEIIRASVAVDQKPMQTKAVASPLIIKLPQQTEHTKRDDPQVSEFTSSSKHSEKDEMEEEDDWDSFQSFSAATDTAAEADANSQGNRQNPEEQKSVDHPSLADENDFDDNDDFQEFSSSLPRVNDKEIYDSKFPEGGKENIGDEHDFSAAQVSESISKLSDDHLIESDGSDHKAFEANTTRSTLGNFSEDDEKETKETHKSGDHLEGSDISDDTVLEANIRCSTDDSSSDNSEKSPNKTLKSDHHLDGTDDSVHEVSEAKTRTSTNDSSSEDGQKKSDVAQNSSCVELHPEEVGDDEREILSRQEVVVVDDLQEFSEAQTLDAESDKGTTKQDLIESRSSSSCSEENAGELT